MLNKRQIKELENLLDERFEIAVITDKRMGNENGNDFLPNNPDFIYYKGILEVCTTLGLTYERKIVNGKAKHLLF
jgi:hypothetical protein